MKSKKSKKCRKCKVAITKQNGCYFKASKLCDDCYGMDGEDDE
jgi:hypothetical protein